MEIAEQRAREEAERFLLPESLMERVRAREVESEHDDGGSSARKRKRPTTGEFATASSWELSDAAYLARQAKLP